MNDNKEVKGIIVQPEVTRLSAQVGAIATLVSTISIDHLSGLLYQYESLETTLPITDPSRWLRDHKKIEQNRLLMQAFIEFRGALTRLEDKTK